MLDPRGVEHWLFAFTFTELVEVPLFMVLARIRAPAAFAASVLTHPIVWFVIPLVCRWIYLGSIYDTIGPLSGPVYWAAYGAVAETFAILVEALYLRWLGVRRPILVAFIVNATSAAIGTVSHALTGWP